jgi:hypothetical protein
VGAEITEVVERHFRPALAGDRCFVRPYPDPVDLAGDPVALSLGTNAANADDSVVVSVPDCPHAVTNPEAAILVGVTAVGPLIDQYLHDVTSPFAED